MLVSDKLKIIFSHIPKSGGGAFRSAMIAAGSAKVVGRHHDKFSDEVIEKHPTYRRVIIVRNSYEMAVSNYRQYLTRCYADGTRAPKADKAHRSYFNGLNAKQQAKHLRVASKKHPFKEHADRLWPALAQQNTPSVLRIFCIITN